CLRGFEIGSRSPARNSVRENARCRPEWLSGPAPSLRSTMSALRRENVRSRIFRRRKLEWPDDRAQIARKDRELILFPRALRLRFHERCGLPAREIRLCAKTNAAAFPSAPHWPTD